MSDIRVARRYAKSLILISQEMNNLDQVHEDMVLVRDTVEESRDLELLLKSPIVNSGKKRLILEAIFGGKVAEVTTKFFQILLRKGRERFLFEITKQFHLQYNDLNSIEMAEVVTPFALTEELRQSFIGVVKEVSGKSGVELRETVNEELIGGYVLRIRDRQIDDSVRSRLNDLAQQLKK
ncbi:MAG: ATP synthase F1 subunit delta [Bacteroidota bacterium]